MKRLVILAAAVFTLASCAKTQVVYNEEPQEIAFRQVENAMTKVNTSLGKWKDGSMGVFAYKTNDGTDYFENAKFAKHSTYSYWVGNTTSYYWPFQGSLDFYFYAPHQADDVSVNTNYNILTISTFTNTDYDSTPYNGEGDNLNYNCADLMYGYEIITKNKDQAADNDGIPVTLKHALALVQVKADATTENLVTIISMKLEDTPLSADLDVEYIDADGDDETPYTGAAVWNNYDETIDLTIVSDESAVGAASAQLGNEVLVIPGRAQTSFKIVYKLAGSITEFTATLPLSTGSTPIWEAGMKYVYKISFGVEEIKFAPEVVEWDEGEVAEGSEGGVSVAAVQP